MGFYEEYVKLFYKFKNVVIISNFVVIWFYGRDFFVVYGRGIEDVVDFVFNRSYYRFVEVMVEFFKFRYIVLIFGNKVLIVFDFEDMFVIESVLDLF